MGFFGFLFALIVLLMVRGVIRRQLKKKQLELKPLTYRKYNPLVTLTEIVHYETLPSFGVASGIIRANLKHVTQEMLKGNENKIIGIDDLPIIYATVFPVSYQHYELFRIFFDDLTKRKVSTKSTLEDIIKAIEFGV